ncbi:MAG: hypothetical protein ABSB40_04260 [Nitrososphaeria archaeon]
MRKEVFDLCFDEKTKWEISQLVDIVGTVTEENRIEDLIKNLKEVEGCIAGWEPIKFTKEVLDQAPNLKIILYSGGSLRPLVSDEVWKRGIRVTSAANVNAIPVAEFTLGIILTTLKCVFRLNTELHQRGPDAWR